MARPPQRASAAALPLRVASAWLALAAAALPLRAAAEPLLDVRLGLPLASPATLHVECDSSGGFSCASPTSETSGDNAAAFAVGFDLLWRLSEHLRLGPGVMIVPGATFEPEDGDAIELGTELPLLLVIEPLLPLSPQSTLFVHLQGGPLLLLPSGDHQEELQRRQDDCDALKEQLPDVSCEVNALALGWSVGAGAGASYALDQVNLRAELLLNYQALQLVHQRIDASSPSFSGAQLNRQRVTGARLWLLVGMEFDL